MVRHPIRRLRRYGAAMLGIAVGLPAAACGARTGIDESIVPGSDAEVHLEGASDAPLDAPDTIGLGDVVLDTPERQVDAALSLPRPIAPLSSSRVTTRRPTMHWVLPPDVSDVTLDLCLDRACTVPIGQPIQVTGTSYAPTSDLPVGVVFWRVHSSSKAMETSPTWEFFVGPRSAPADTSWGTTLDVNGDGYADLAIAQGNRCNSDAGCEADAVVYVYYGVPTGFSGTPSASVMLLGSVDDAFGSSVVSAGDVNGDGYADLMVGAPRVGSFGRAYLYLGGPDGLETKATSTVDYGLATSAGDVNGDGYCDILASGGSRGHIFFGSASGLGTTSRRLQGPPVGADTTIASLGDVNGDGYGDVAVNTIFVEPGSPDASGVVYVYLGGPGGPARAPSVMLTGLSSTDFFAMPMGGAGDVNGDGYADLAVETTQQGEAGSSTGLVNIYLGGTHGLSSTVSSTLMLPSSPSFPSAAGDLNGDGIGDLLVALPGSGSIYVFFGHADALNYVSSTARDGFSDQLVASAAAGVNRQGFGDLVVGDPLAGPGGAAYLFPGSASGQVTVPSATFVGPDGTYYGSAVFGSSD